MSDDKRDAIANALGGYTWIRRADGSLWVHSPHGYLKIEPIAADAYDNAWPHKDDGSER